MTAEVVDTQFSYLDSVLGQVCAGVQLTETQYEDARKKYLAIGNWLATAGSDLRWYGPDIYPQGSMHLGTTIRPWKGEEFDLDIVCQLDGCGHHPASAVYEMVANRLRQHGTYRELLETKCRCLRINYAGDFHLDIIPACPNGAGALKVPDHDKAVWISSNPMGYADWFFDCCRIGQQVYKASEARVAPMPDQVPSAKKYPLQRAVQLLKRHRDSLFNGNTDAARSILLTTLAAGSYRGQQSLTLALDGIINNIWALICASEGIPRVPNPVNLEENLASGWNAQTYPQFVTYVRSVRAHLDRLINAEGLDRTKAALSEFVGESQADRAVKAHAQNIQQSRTTGSLRIERSTGILTTAGGLGIPRNNFFGA